MQKYSKFRYSYRYPERGTCLGLQTSASFELELLEVAVRGRKVFEKSWNKWASIDEQVMFLEILEEIQHSEKTGCNKLLVERARNLVVRMRDRRSFHQRALIVYRDILSLRYSRTGTSCSSQQREVSLVPGRNTESTSSHTLTLDEKFDEVMLLEFPDTDDESSISIEFRLSINQGEPSGIPCELTGKINEVSCESPSIFKKPKVTDEGVMTHIDFTPDNPSEIDSNTENYEDEDSALTLENRYIHCVKYCLGDEPHPQSLLKKTNETNESKEFSEGDGADEKIDLLDVHVPQLLGGVPERDFKFLTWWTVDGVSYRAKSIADLRRKHNVLIEGAFRKRCRYHKWRSYYGFILDTGIMIYFRDGAFKKVADFRNISDVLLKIEQCSLNIKDLHLASTVTNWIIKFASKTICKSWYEIIVKISRNGKIEVNGLQDTLLETKYI